MMNRYLLALAFFAISCLSAFSQAPVNDVCANALPITVNGGYVSVNNSTTVTNGPNPSCGGSTLIKDVWYSFVYTGGSVIVETQLGTNTDTRIAVYSSCGGTQLACNDDFGGTFRSSLTLTCSQLTAGNTYLIQAGGYNATVGAFTLQVTASGILGCTDPMATNYLACSTQNNGTCVYPVLTSQFNYAPTGTNCLNVQYTSTSSGNILGYNWSFPGGSPSTSTLQNPVVTYPSAGTYSATLVINDAAGTSTSTNNNVVVTAGDIVTVDITPDASPAQTSWKMFDNNGVVVAQGTSNDATFCINSFCHRFEIYDSGGNGLASPGGYKIYLNGIEVANGATFASKDIRDVNCPDGTSCNNTLTAVLGVNDVPFDNSWYVFTPTENGQYRISTCGYAACDTRIWIYDYCVMANFDNTNVATYTYNDDFCGVQAQSDVFMTGGHTYYIRIGSAGACAGSSYEALFEYVGPITGCTDNLACNYNPLASVSGPCYYNGDPNCSGLGPDLLVDQSQFFSSLTSTTLTSTDACLVNEGCLQSTVGTRQILRFTTRIANIGTQDYFIGVPNASNPQFIFDACHSHYHYAGYAEYLLYDATGSPMPNIGFKNGFCVLDLSCPTGITAHYSCGNMGITAGCADIYSSSLSCQWIDVTGVPAGDYYLVIRTNWDQSPDANGRYELRYDNNWAQVCIHFDRDANNNIINFTKTITTCPIIEDCLGVPFGNHYPDCAGNCPGTVIQGDVNSDGYFTAFDEHLYAEAAINGGVAVTPCSDLNQDGEITVADASYVADCIHHQQDLGVNPLQYTSCAWDPETWDNENVVLGLTNLNTTDHYFDVYIENPQNEIYALQMDFSGVAITSLENLLPIATWNAHLHQEVGGNSIAVTSELHTWVPVSFTPRSILRVHYSSLTGNTICISNIIDVLNDFNHNVLATIGDCVSIIPPVVADFTASQTSICSGQSVSFTDTSTGGATSWAWTFPGGNPSSSTAQNPSVQYSTAGVYTVSLTANGPGGGDSEVKTAYITVGSSVQWFMDQDNDGYGTNSSTVFACNAPVGFVAQGGDCADNNNAVNPGATEVCNNIDDDCDGSIDEGFDLDNDGYTTCDGDCDDGNALRYPGAFEICNGVDENCNGTIDEGFDADNDGYTVCGGDCNDNNNSIHPGAPEVCNGVDEDCDGQVDEGFDTDNDGYTTCAGDCNNNNASVYPGATEICNGIDDDCDGSTDEGFDADNDGFTTCNGDCNDNNPDVNPEAGELCNGFDDDCNGLVDEGYDVDNDGYTTCEGDCNDSNSAVHPGATEICNSIDDNCNGSTDEGFDADNDGYTVCAGDCNDANAAVKPGTLEVCNGIDDDCDGSTDEGFDLDNDGYSVCAGDCNDSNAAVKPGAIEVCNGIDDNCNGLTDEGFDLDQDGYTVCQGDCDDNSPNINPGVNEICGNGEDDNCDGQVLGDNFQIICPQNTSVPCGTDISTLPGVVLVDACGEYVIDVVNTLIGFNCPYVYQRDFTITQGEQSFFCTQIVTIIDNTPPTIACPANMNVTTLAGANTAMVEYVVTANDECGAPTVNASHPSGSFFNIGLTTVAVSAIDACGNVTSCSFTVNVQASFTWFFDGDGDGYGKSDQSVEASVQPTGYVAQSGDCNDNNASVYPGAGELCNGFDDNCNGSTDEGFDADNDGYTTCAGDCDDSNSAIHPGATEICNNSDDDCDGLADENLDADNDGYTSCNGDCNDNNASVNPGATELCNGIDDNCNGITDEGFDLDNDGYTTCAGDCNDNNAAVHPNATEVCNGVNDDCDATIDEGFDLDNDGYTSCNGDCNDNNASIHPGAVEVCNNISDDCDAQIDEGFDVDNDGFTSCGGDCNDNNSAIFPGSAEACNNLDDDCDGTIDEGFDNDNDGYTTCNGDCNDNNAAIRPGLAESCNGIDDNCNTTIDENAGPIWYRDQDNDGYGNPAISLQACLQPTGYVNNNLDCADNNATRHPGAFEYCNLTDDDCDGVIDDNCANVVNDFYQDAIPVPVFALNSCTGIGGTLSGATVSPQSQSTVIAGGQDVWYTFVATSIGIRILVITSAADVLIELQDAQGNVVNVENVQNIKGKESLNYSGLVVGATYYFAVRNNNSALGTGSFVVCLNSRPNSSCVTSGGAYGLCNAFTAENTSANSYTYNFTSQTTGLTYSKNIASTSCVLYNVPGLPANDWYNVRIDANYIMTLGNGVNETITVVGPTTCTAQILENQALYLRDNLVCPSARLMGSQIRTNYTLCGVLEYQWQFQLSNQSQPAFTISSGTNSSLFLTTAAGFALGQTYNVKIRGVFLNGYAMPWGPTRCMVISATGMIMEGEDNESFDETRMDEVQVSIYPNPNLGDALNLYINEVKNGEVGVRIMDGMGRVVWTNRYFTDNYLNTQITFESPLASGVYVMEMQFDGEVITRRIVIQK